jgi:hypothetical protein
MGQETTAVAKRYRTLCDFSVSNHGSLFLLTPLSEAAREWAQVHIDMDSALRFAGAIVVEHRYIADIVAGIQNDGLAVSR